MLKATAPLMLLVWFNTIFELALSSDKVMVPIALAAWLMPLPDSVIVPLADRFNAPVPIVEVVSAKGLLVARLIALLPVLFNETLPLKMFPA